MPRLFELEGLPFPLDTQTIVGRSKGTSMQEIKSSGMFSGVQGVSGATGLATGGSIQELRGTDETHTGKFSLDIPNQLMLMGAATAPLTGTGMYMGFDDPDYELRIGNPAGNYLHWDGTNLTIVGGLTATTGTIGGWTINATTLTSGNVTLDAGNEAILLGAATAPLTGIGVFIGEDGASGYDFRVGDPAGDYIHWDASTSTFEINSDSFTGSNPIFSGSVSVRGGEGGNRVRLLSTGGSGAIQLVDSNGVTQVSFFVSDTPDVTINAVNGPLHIGSNDLVIDNGDLEVTIGSLSVGTPQTYTPSNVTTDRSYNANSTTLDEVADVLGTLIGDLQTIGLLV